MTSVYFTERGKERFDDLEPDAREQVRKKLKQCEEFTEHHLKPLKGRDDYRVRAGNYRALVQWDRGDDVLYVKSVGHRRNFYDRL